MLRVLVVTVGIGLFARLSPEVGQDRGHQNAHFPFPFTDEAAQDLDFKTFRDRLLQAVRSRDPKALADSMSPELRAKEASWLAPPLFKTIAYETQRALELGGSFTTTRGEMVGRREFCAPYVYSAFPNSLPNELEGEADPWAIIGSHVPVREERQPNARVLAYLSWELVKANGWYEDSKNQRWAKVDLSDGRSGYVQEGKIRPDDDYHVCFAKIAGRWLMTWFARDEPPSTGERDRHTKRAADLGYVDNLLTRSGQRTYPTSLAPATAVMAFPGSLTQSLKKLGCASRAIPTSMSTVKSAAATRTARTVRMPWPDPANGGSSGRPEQHRISCTLRAIERRHQRAELPRSRAVEDPIVGR